MVYVLVTIFLCYFLLVIVLIVGWFKALGQRNEETFGRPGISVVVSARNEEHTIGPLLRNLIGQKYQDFEVIIVDDHSDDNTRVSVEEIVHADDRFRLIRNPGEGKKQAIASGVQAARKPIIVTTDADCSVESQWLSIIGSYFQEDRVKMLVGGVRIQQTGTFYSTLQALEFSSLIGTAAATLAFGCPTMCNGANLAFRKTVFEEVNGYEGNLHIPSGDDEFLMRKVAQKHRDGVLFCGHADAVVATRPAGDLNQFVHQRIRWASKWRFNSSFYSKGLAIFVLILQFSSAFVLLQFIRSPETQWGLILLVKTILEGIFIFAVCRFLKVRWHWLAFLALQFIHPFYVVGIGLFSTLMPYTWKGRKIHPVTLPE